MIQTWRIPWFDSPFRWIHSAVILHSRFLQIRLSFSDAPWLDVFRHQLPILQETPLACIEPHSSYSTWCFLHSFRPWRASCLPVQPPFILPYSRFPPPSTGPVHINFTLPPSRYSQAPHTDPVLNAVFLHGGTARHRLVGFADCLRFYIIWIFCKMR